MRTSINWIITTCSSTIIITFTSRLLLHLTTLRLTGLIITRVRITTFSCPEQWDSQTWTVSRKMSRIQIRIVWLLSNKRYLKWQTTTMLWALLGALLHHQWADKLLQWPWASRKTKEEPRIHLAWLVFYLRTNPFKGSTFKATLKEILLTGKKLAPSNKTDLTQSMRTDIFDSKYFNIYLSHLLWTKYYLHFDNLN